MKVESKQSKLRLDQAFLTRGLIESREKAQRLIMAGQVLVNGVIAPKASQKVSEKDAIELVAPDRFVSRGGKKLEAVLEKFHITCRDKVCLDLGASTGGFTDCLLQHGAKSVFAVDVGKDQIAWKLRNDPRVHIFDKLNARYLKPTLFNQLADLVTADLSFISLCKVLPAAILCARAGADFIVLIKPQFEAGREQVGKGGVVRDPIVHEKVIKKIQTFVETSLNCKWLGVVESPITGPAGNKEFLAWFQTQT